MKYYLAPLEGITGYIYRNAYEAHFGHIDKYFTPFLSPNQNKVFVTREIKDTSHEYNHVPCLVPQIMSNKADQFLWAAYEMEKLDYREVNLNLGCPYKTVASKGRGSGFLRHTWELEQFLNAIYQDPLFRDGRMGLSIKTRIGTESHEEFPELLALFNQYPLTELIIHPRIQKEMYEGTPDWDSFELAVRESRNPLCYNGDICSEEDMKRLTERFPSVDTVMIGRGVLKDPGLILRLYGEQAPDLKTLKSFHDTLYNSYMEVMYGEKNVLFKMKALWNYWQCSFPEEEEAFRKIRKSKNLAEYRAAVREIFP